MATALTTKLVKVSSDYFLRALPDDSPALHARGLGARIQAASLDGTTRIVTPLFLQREPQLEALGLKPGMRLVDDGDAVWPVDVCSSWKANEKGEVLVDEESGVVASPCRT